MGLGQEENEMRETRSQKKAPLQRWRAGEGQKSKQRELDDCTTEIPKRGLSVKKRDLFTVLLKCVVAVRLLRKLWVLDLREVIP